MFDFPGTPTIGQRYAPIPGAAYLWDGVAWKIEGGPIAPLDQLVVGSDASMTSSLTVKAGHGDPILRLHSKYNGNSFSTPDLELYSDRATWATDDFGGAIRLRMGDPDGVNKVLAYFTSNLWDTTPGAENANAFLGAMSGGSSMDVLRLSQGVCYLSHGKLGFPATQEASSSPNVMDDYEEGAFSPVIVGLTAAGVGTYTIQSGRYLKWGRAVFIEIVMTWTAHTGTGNIQIDGLPFTVHSLVSAPCVINCADFTYPGFLVSRFNAGAANVAIQSQATGAATASIAMDTAGTLRLAGVYTVA